MASDAMTVMRDPKFLLGVSVTESSGASAGDPGDLSQQRLAGLKRAKLLDNDPLYAAQSVAKIFQVVQCSIHC